jgi:hypothetical protein
LRQQGRTGFAHYHRRQSHRRRSGQDLLETWNRPKRPHKLLGFSAFKRAKTPRKGRRASAHYTHPRPVVNTAGRTFYYTRKTCLRSRYSRTLSNPSKGRTMLTPFASTCRPFVPRRGPGRVCGRLAQGAVSSLCPHRPAPRPPSSVRKEVRAPGRSAAVCAAPAAKPRLARMSARKSRRFEWTPRRASGRTLC